MKSPLVSIIVTSYNDAKALPKSLTALQNQTLEDIEIICIDDASTDDSVEVIQKFCKQDQRFTLVKNSKNTGPSPSTVRNKAMSKAKADYIMFCDADDYYDDTMCEKLYQAISKHQADLAICEVNVIYEAHQEMKLSDDNYYGLKYNGLQMVNGDIINNTDSAPTNKIFRKSIINKYSIRFPDGLHFEDAYFCSAYLFVSQKIVYVNERLYNYIRHANSIMSQTWSKSSVNDFAIEHFYIATKLFDFLEENTLLTKYNATYWQLFAAYLSFAVNNSKSSTQIKKVRSEAKSFVLSHQELLADVDISTKEQIQKLYSSKFHIDSVRIKRILIRMMPTYRLEIENIQRLRTLRNKNQQIISEIDARLHQRSQDKPQQKGQSKK